MNMNLKNSLWILPFIAFFLGYYITNRLFTIKEIDVPLVIGKEISEASKLLSDTNLNLRIVAQKENDDIPEGTILDQTPIRQKIKPNQSVYLVISKKSEKFTMPNMLGKEFKEIEAVIKKAGIRIKVYYIDSQYKKDVCLSQLPSVGQQVNKNEKIILYLSSGQKKQVLCPDFNNIELSEVVNFLKLNEIKYTVVTQYNQQPDPQKKYVIIDQRPICGSIMNINNSINIQLLVKEV